VARNPAVLVSLLADWDGKDLDKAMREIEKMRAQTQTFSDKFAAMGKKMQDVGASVSKVGGNLTKTVTLPIVGIGAAAVATAVEFETSMSKIVGLVGIATDEVKSMEASVLDLAGETAKAPQELADALFVITSAGLRGADAMDALEFAAKAGAAGLGETNDIARALAGSMNAYGSEVVDAARATDVIVATARAGNFETSQFAGALGRVLPFAKQAGSSIEDLGGAVALLTRTNGDAAQSVTQVQALFRAFVVPTQEAKKILSELGLSAGDLRDAISRDGLPAALQMLDTALSGNRETLGRLLGSSEAASAAFQILDADAAALEGTFGAVNQAAGITDEAFDVVAGTTQFQLNQALTQLKASLIEIGAIITPFVAQFAQGFEQVASAFRNLTPAQQQLIVQIGAIAAAIGPALLIVGKLISTVGVLVAAFNPVTLKIAAVIAVIGLLVAAFTYAWQNSETLRNTVTGVFETIRSTVQSVIESVRSALDRNRDSIETLRTAFQAITDFLLTYVVPALVTFYSIYLQGLITFLGIVATYLIELISVFVQFTAKLIEVGIAIVTFTTNAAATINAWVTGLQATFTNAFTAVRDFIGAVFSSIYNSITTTIKQAVNFVIGAINRVIGAWNGLSFTVPSVTVPFVGTFGGQNIGVRPLPPIPELAEGGIVNKATLAIIGEAGPEAVVPLSRRGDQGILGGTNITINVTAGMGTDGAELGRQIVDAIKSYERRNGAVYATA
jgi:TP901 family phage tail tape measure protein